MKTVGAAPVAITCSVGAACRDNRAYHVSADGMSCVLSMRMRARSAGGGKPLLQSSRFCSFNTLARRSQ
jgi:hypothetical protein